MAFTPVLRSLLRVPRLHSLSGRAFSTSPQLAVARLTVLGRLAAPPELITTSSGGELVRYTLATTRPGVNKQTDWWRVVYFVKEHELYMKDILLKLTTGSQVYMEGDASTRKYEDKDGNQQSTLSIVQKIITIIYKKRDGSEGASEAAPEGHSAEESEGGSEAA